MGGSYGGYATLVGMTFTPQAFSCGVNFVGVSDLVTLLEVVFKGPAPHPQGKLLLSLDSAEYGAFALQFRVGSLGLRDLQLPWLKGAQVEAENFFRTQLKNLRKDNEDPLWYERALRILSFISEKTAFSGPVTRSMIGFRSPGQLKASLPCRSPPPG